MIEPAAGLRGQGRLGEVRVRCPICQREAPRAGNPFRPFCSERCKLIDLDNWLAGRYRVSTPVNEPERVRPEGSTGSDLGDGDVTADD